MVEIGSEVRKARLAALMERAQVAYDRSRRVVEESRKIRAEMEAKRSEIPKHSPIVISDDRVPELEQAAD